MRRSPLHDRHVELGAKLTPFGGWEMPLQYATGTIAEHRACRESAVVFDVSHLGTVRVGDGDALQRTLTNDLDKIGPGRAQYTHLLDEEASVLDDIIIWWIDPETFDVMPNASNTSRVVDGVGGEDVTDQRAVIAAQGPRARRFVAAVSQKAADVDRFRVERVEWDGVPLVVAGTGYTGEDGIEISVPSDEAGRLWDALVAAGATPAGLGARDTLRLEAGLPLHGHELGPGITPLQAGLGWVVAWDKPSGFVGRDALVAERERGVHRKLRGISTEGRRPPRAEQPVVVDGQPIGEVTSGNFSPTLEHGIAMAFLPPDIENGSAVEIDARGTAVKGKVVKMPFYTR